jgi:capsular polysaccharide transport system permease protein
MSDDQEKPDNPPSGDRTETSRDPTVSPNLPRAPSGERGTRREIVRDRGASRELARKRNLSPPVRSPSAPPSEPTPFVWPGVLEPAQLLLDSRRTSRRRFFLRLAIFSGLPTLFTLLYMLFVASPRYVSEFQVTYQTYQPPQNLSSGLVQNLLGSSQGSTIDFGTILYQYIGSQALLAKLDRELHLREYYSSPKVDYLSRMNPKATISTFLRYYGWYVSVSEGQGGYVTVDVQAFDPDYALAVAKAILTASDQMADGMTLRARHDEVRYAEAEVKQAEDRVRKARLALTDFQNAHGDLNPAGSANQLHGIVGTIEGNLAAARTTLTMLTQASPHSPQIATVKYQIAALEGQLKQEQHRLANDSGGVPYSKLLDQYSALQLEQQFAQTAYQAAQQGLVVARADASRQQNYLIDFVPPYRPDKQNIEFALVYTLTALIASLVLFGIGSLIGGAMRDQAGM